MTSTESFLLTPSSLPTPKGNPGFTREPHPIPSLDYPTGVSKLFPLSSDVSLSCLPAVLPRPIPSFKLPPCCLQSRLLNLAWRIWEEPTGLYAFTFRQALVAAQWPFYSPLYITCWISLSTTSKLLWTYTLSHILIYSLFSLLRPNRSASTLSYTLLSDNTISFFSHILFSTFREWDVMVFLNFSINSSVFTLLLSSSSSSLAGFAPLSLTSLSLLVPFSKLINKFEMSLQPFFFFPQATILFVYFYLLLLSLTIFFTILCNFDYCRPLFKHIYIILQNTFVKLKKIFLFCMFPSTSS